MAFLSSQLDNDVEEELRNFKRIPGDYNMEIPEVVHLILRCFEAPDIIKLGLVSKQFRKCATSDLLWEEIMIKKNQYIPENLNVNKMSFFYDLRNMREGTYTKVMNKFQRAYKRKEKVRKRKKKEEFNEAAEDVMNTVVKTGVPVSVIFAIALIDVICPPIGALIQSAIGWYLLVDLDLLYLEIEHTHIISFGDSVCTLCFSTCGFFCCCQFLRCFCNMCCGCCYLCNCCLCGLACCFDTILSMWCQICCAPQCVFVFQGVFWLFVRLIAGETMDYDDDTIMWTSPTYFCLAGLYYILIQGVWEWFLDLID